MLFEVKQVNISSLWLNSGLTVLLLICSVGIFVLLSGVTHMPLSVSPSVQAAPAPMPDPMPPGPFPADLLSGAHFVSVAFSPSNRTVAISGELLCNSSYAGLILWDLDNDCKRFVVQKDLTFIYAFAFSPDGKFFATGHREGAVRLWETSSCKKVVDLGTHKGRVHSVAFSPNGEWLATCSVDKKIILWDMKKRKERLTLDIHSCEVEAVAFSHDSRLLASVGSYDRLCLTDVASGKLSAVLEEGKETTYISLAFHPKKNVLVCAGDRFQFWDCGTCKEVAALKGEDGSISTEVTYSPDGRLLAWSAQEWY